MYLDDNNIEQFIFLYKEGLLDATGKAALEEALANNVEWQQLAEMYDPTLLVPTYPHLSYPAKDKLHAMATPSKPKAVVIPFWTRVAAACALLVAVMLMVRIHRNNTVSPTSCIVASNHSKIPADTTATTPQTLADVPSAATTPHLSMAKPVSTEPQAITSDSRDPWLTEQLITYIDDNDTSFDYLLCNNTQEPCGTLPTPSATEIEYTDQLICFEDDGDAISIPPMPEPGYIPPLQSAVNDWFSNLQLARIEFQTYAISNIYKTIENK